MALKMYLSRAPRYENITAKDIELMELFFSWKQENEAKGPYACKTFEEWCGHSESELPNLHVMKFFHPFYTMQTREMEGIGEVAVYGILEQLARLVKTNQVFNWFCNNVMNGKAERQYYEVSKDQIQALLDICYQVKQGFTLVRDGKDEYEKEYSVDNEVAAKLLPTMSEQGYFFGSIDYDTAYAHGVVKTIEALENILNTTDFKTQIIYFNATW